MVTIDTPHRLHPIESAVVDDAPTTIVGTDHADQLDGSWGDDVIYGLGGDDDLHGYDGDDTLYGGSGKDGLDDESTGGDDVLIGNGGDDWLTIKREFATAPSSATLIGGTGNDQIMVTASATDQLSVTANGGAGDDSFGIVGAPNVVIETGDGDDSISLWGQPHVRIMLGIGHDVIRPLEYQIDSDFTAPLIHGFDPGKSGDNFDLTYFQPLEGVLQNWDGGNPFGEGYLRLIQNGADTDLRIDVDGPDGSQGWRNLAVFKGTEASQFTGENFGGYPPDGGPVLGHTISGTNKNDDLQGTEGGDLINGLRGDDLIDAHGGADTVNGGAGTDVVDGGAGDDSLIGGAGGDYLFGGESDTMLGQAGRDTLTFQDDTLSGGASYLSGGAGADTLQAGGAAVFNPGVSTLDGGVGNDTIQISHDVAVSVLGGAGNDSVALSDVGAHVTLNLGAGSDLITLAAEQRSDFRLTVEGLDTGAGGDRIDYLAWLANADPAWDGNSNPFGDGILRLQQSGGDAILQLHSASGWGDVIVFQAVDVATISVDNLDGYPSDGSAPPGHLYQGTAGNDSMTGGVGPDTMNGAGGDDHLDGGRGSDSVDGGAGDDVLNGAIGDDSLFGGFGFDTLDGSDGVDVLHGGDENDLLTDTSGPSGALYGDDGSDTLYVQRISGAASFHLDGGADNDSLLLTNADDAILTATLLGGSGDDNIQVMQVADAVIDAGDDDDKVILGVVTGHVDVTLGEGRDTLVLGHIEAPAQDIVIEDFNAADGDVLDVAGVVPSVQAAEQAFDNFYVRLVQVRADTVLQADMDPDHSDAFTDVLIFKNLDARTLTSLDLTFQGVWPLDPGPIWKVAGSGADALTTGGGYEGLDGAAGADRLTGDAAANALFGQSGADTLVGNGDADTLRGGSESDSLDGGAGSDVVVGGLGADILTGGTENDVFKFTDVQDSTAAAPDRITDLTNGDVIDLSGVDANSQISGDQAFTIVDGFYDRPGQLVISYGGGVTKISGDVDGDGHADLVITIAGDHRDFANIVL